MNNKVQPFFEDVTLWDFNMKKSKGKSKFGRGGARPGAGGVCRWKHGRTKLVRLPVALLDKILEVARYIPLLSLWENKNKSQIFNCR